MPPPTRRRVARVPPGDGLTDAQRARLAHAVETADGATGLSFLVRVGVLDGGRAAAEALLAARGADAARTVLVAVDPPARALEIVTGSTASTVLDDRTCALASLTMTTSFAVISAPIVGASPEKCARSTRLRAVPRCCTRETTSCPT